MIGKLISISLGEHFHVTTVSASLRNLVLEETWILEYSGKKEFLHKKWASHEKPSKTDPKTIFNVRNKIKASLRASTSHEYIHVECTWLQALALLLNSQGPIN